MSFAVPALHFCYSVIEFSKKSPEINNYSLYFFGYVSENAYLNI